MNFCPNIRFLALLFVGFAFGMTSCSTSSFNWPAENPFGENSELDFQDFLIPERLEVELVFSANQLGQLEPCGCATGPKGGQDRRLNFAKKLPSKSNRIFLDGGNAFFPSFPIDQSRVEVFAEKADLIAETQKLIGIQAQGIGENDLGLGVDFLLDLEKKHGLQFVSANLSYLSDQLVFKPFVDLEVKNNVFGKKLRVIGLTGPLEGVGPLGVKQLPPQEALISALKDFPEDGIVVVLSDLGRQADLELAGWTNRPLIIIGARENDSLGRPEHRGASIILQPQFRGQQFGQIRMLFPKDPHNSWYDPAEVKRFARMWDDLEADRKQDLSALSAEHRENERKTQERIARDLIRYAPTKLTEGVVYQHELHSLDFRYAQPNELSKRIATLVRKEFL